MGTDIFVMACLTVGCCFSLLAASTLLFSPHQQITRGGANLVRDQVSLALYAQSTASADEVR